MFLRIESKVVLTATCICVLFAGSIAAQDCVYKDEYGEPVMHVGGAALAGGIALMDPSGTMGIPDNYELWDLNADGVPDKVQFALLTEILCMSAAAPHPTINIAEIQSTFEDNLAAYWHIINTMAAAEALFIAGAPDLRQVGIELGTAINAHPTITGSTPLPPEVFGGTVPDAWVGATWEDLRYTLRETGDGVNWLYNNGYMGGPTAPLWLLANNEAVAYIMAALWGLDTNFTATVFFDSTVVVLLNQFLSLQELNWPYILGQFASHGLSTTTVGNVENTINEIGLDESLLPGADTLAITSNGADALHASVIWGTDTFLDLYNNNGGDVTAIWEDIVAQFPPMPVGGVAGLIVGVACALGGALFLKKNKA